MRLLHISKNRQHQHFDFGKVDGLQESGTAVITNSRVFVSQNVVLIGLICISLIAVIYGFASLTGHTVVNAKSLRNASIQLPSTGSNQTPSSTTTPNDESSVNVVTTNDSKSNSTDGSTNGVTTNVNLNGESDNSATTSMSVNGQPVTTPSDGSFVQTSVSPDQTTSVAVSNSHNDNGNSNGFSFTNDNLSINSYSNSQVQEGE